MGNKERRPFWERPGTMVLALPVMLGVGLALGVGLGSILRPLPLPVQVEAPPPPASFMVEEPSPPEIAPPEPQASETAPIEAAPPATASDDPAPGVTRDAEAMLPPPAPIEAPAVPVPAAPVVPPAPSSPAQIAMVPPVVKPPRPPAPPAGAALWLRHAVPPPPIAGRPMIAVIIDDVGVDRRRAEQVVKLPGPLTLSFMSYATDLTRLTGEARRHGHELMVHVPMQPMSATIDAGPEVLIPGQSAEEIRRRLTWALSRFDGYIGINNHMGSRFTADPAGMAVVMAELHQRGLAFVDSMTTERSVGAQIARQYGVPVVARDIFIDNEQNVALIQAQLAKAEARARRTGFAIAIGHPHDTTMAALTSWMAGLPGRGVVLVPVSTLIRAESAH